MKSRKLMALAIVLVLALALLLPSCAGTGETTTTTTPPPTTAAMTTTATEPTATEPTISPDEPQYGGTLRQLTTGSLANLGYSPTIPGHMTSFIFGCLEGFVKHNGRTGEYGPWLFTSWDEDPEEKYITFYCREGVKYHDGTDFNAQAAKDYLDLKKSLNPGWLANVTSIEVIDEYTVKLNTTHYNIVMWTELNEQHASPTQLAKGEEACLWLPVGTGPFKFVEYKRDQYLKYERFDEYWGGKPYLETFELIFMPDATAQLAALLAGEGHHIRAIQFRDIELLESKGFNLYDMPMVMCGLLPDTSNPDSIFADIRVREAVEYAIDRDTIAKELGYGYMDPLDTVYPAPIPGYAPGIGRQYDQAKAKQLLADAGYSGGFETTMYVSQFANMDVMVAVQGCLAEVGIIAHISEVDMGKWMALRKGGWDGLLYQHGIFQAPYEYNLNRAFGAAYADYVSAVRPEGFDDLLTQLMNTTDVQARSPLAKQMQEMVRDSAFFIPLVTWSQIDAVVPQLRDHHMYEIHGTQCWAPELAWFSED